jgi:hypothetical protein
VPGLPLRLAGARLTADDLSGKVFGPPMRLRGGLPQGMTCGPIREIVMHLTTAHVAPLVALIAGILILIVPRLLNYIVAIYLIIIGLAGLNGLYHFIR